MNNNQKLVVSHVLMQVKPDQVLDEAKITQLASSFAMIEEMSSGYKFSDAEIQAIVNELQTKLIVRMDRGACLKNKNHISWYYAAKANIENSFWSRYTTYLLFADKGVKNIDDFNHENPDHRLPRIVIIVDEYAELMYEAANDIEQTICSLARKSRAAGIYLIISTQRPNSEVITAQIRANIPARIAFSVINWRESHTIINASGAEKLLGSGDMLYAASDTINVTHAQASFVSDEEIDKVLEYITTPEEDYDYFTD